MNRESPIHCTPCRVTYEGQRYQIEANGEVRVVAGPFEDGSKASFVDTRYERPVDESLAKLVRREASRQRRNRNSRERSQAMKDLGLKRAPGGAFGGWVSY